MRTTIDLPDPLYRAMKTRAVQQGLKLKDLVAQYLQAGLHARISKQGATPPERIAPPIPIARAKDGTVTPALTNAELNAILADEDLENYRRVLNS